MREKNEAPCDDAASDFECGRTRSITKGFLPTIKLVNLSTGGRDLPSNCASHIHEEFSRPNLGRFLENVPNWVVFERMSISTKVRVSADSHGLGDHGLGAGLVVRRRHGGEID